jgi:hypothetical protein
MARKLNENTVTKYYNFMSELYNMENFHLDAARKRNHVSATIPTLLRQQDVVQGVESDCTWIGPKPTWQFAEKIVKENQDYGKKDKSKSHPGFTETQALRFLKGLKLENGYPKYDIQVNNVTITKTPA